VKGAPQTIAGPAITVDDITVKIREFLERIMDERDRLYVDKFKAAETAVNTALAAQEKAVNAALAAQEKQTASSFAASEKAIVKAENAQTEYNMRSNEFRGQLDDQAKMLMPRAEVNALLKAIEEKIYSSKTELESRLTAANTASEKTIDTLTKDISGLRESRSEGSGRSSGSQQMWGYVAGAFGIIFGAIGLLLAVLRFKG
jgi:hypothetical protein